MYLITITMYQQISCSILSFPKGEGGGRTLVTVTGRREEFGGEGGGGGEGEVASSLGLEVLPGIFLSCTKIPSGIV